MTNAGGVNQKKQNSLPADGDVLLVRNAGGDGWVLRVATGDAQEGDQGVAVGCLPASDDDVTPCYYHNWKHFQDGVPLSAQV